MDAACSSHRGAPGTTFSADLGLSLGVRPVERDSEQWLSTLEIRTDRAGRRSRVAIDLEQSAADALAITDGVEARVPPAVSGTAGVVQQIREVEQPRKRCPEAGRGDHRSNVPEVPSAKSAPVGVSRTTARRSLRILPDHVAVLDHQPHAAERGVVRHHRARLAIRGSSASRRARTGRARPALQPQ